MLNNLIKSLLVVMPRYAEEEGDFFSVPRSVLIDALCQQQTERVIAETVVSLLENLLDTLAVLDSTYLQKGEWCFVSFPAQLLASSVLSAISDADSRLFATNFWNTQGIGNDKKDQQRDVLRKIELARFEHHLQQKAQPIRYCYVAWSIIKQDGKILFYQREDTQKRFDKSAGDYGLIGGRANQNDLSGLFDKHELLNALQSPNSQLVKSALPETLKRELREEAGLEFKTHYSFKPWRELKPYRQVQGSAPNHALTEYYLTIYQIELTLEGFLFLQQRIFNDNRLTWIAIADIERGETFDGKIPYIKALYDDFDGNRSGLAASLTDLPDSFCPSYLLDKENFSITLPIYPNQAVLVGKLGKEKPLDLTLNAQQLALVLGLAAHLRNFEFSTLVEGIVLHPHGWIEIAEHTPIRAELVELAEALTGTELVIENRRNCLFRLSIKPESVCFAHELFTFSVKQNDLLVVENKIPVTINRKSFDTAIGQVDSKTETFNLPLDFVHKLKTLSEQAFSADHDDAIKIEDAYKKGLHQNSKFKALGLLKLIRREAGMIKFLLDFRLN